MGLLFYNGDTSKSFSNSTEKQISSLLETYFIEYLSEDLNSFKMSEKKVFNGGGASLLGSEKQGIERLTEALQTCMWTSMNKKKAATEI